MKYEMTVEANSFDGSQVFACEADSPEEAVAKFKADIIEVNIEVLGLDADPYDVQESTDITSRLSQDVILAQAAEVKRLTAALNEVSEKSGFYAACSGDKKTAIHGLKDTHNIASSAIKSDEERLAL